MSLCMDVALSRGLSLHADIEPRPSQSMGTIHVGSRKFPLNLKGFLLDE